MYTGPHLRWTDAAAGYDEVVLVTHAASGLDDLTLVIFNDLDPLQALHNLSVQHYALREVTLLSQARSTIWPYTPSWSTLISLCN